MSKQEDLTAIEKKVTTNGSSSRHEHEHAFSEVSRPIVISPSVGTNLGSPTALAIGAFATTLTTLSLSLMEWRGVTTTNVYIGNFFFVAGIGMVISAQWELVRGNSYGYTVLSAFGLFYGGFGAIITPSFGVTDSYGSDTAEYNNALGFFMINRNLVYIGIFATVELAFLLVAASYFAAADGNADASVGLKKAGGVFAFLSGLLGYYTLGHLMCQEALFFSFPMGSTERFFKKKELNEERPQPQHQPVQD
ncbi:hypothetical protein SLS57_003296 [Botryosphaeria dothidea]